VTIGRFHLDSPRPRPHPRRPAKRALLRESDHEPVSFPFRFGLASNHERFLFAFDHAGEWC